MDNKLKLCGFLGQYKVISRKFNKKIKKVNSALLKCKQSLNSSEEQIKYFIKSWHSPSLFRVEVVQSGANWHRWSKFKITNLKSYLKSLFLAI